MLNNLTQYLINSAKTYPNKIALVCNNKAITYEELLNDATAFASILLKSGISRGDRVVISLGNIPQAIICFWGALLSDAIVSLIDKNLSLEKFAYIINDAGASFVITNKSKDELSGIISNIKHNPVILSLDNLGSLEKIDPMAIRTKQLEIDLATIIYTSGSTGEPKGVMLTHRNMLSAASAINFYLGNLTKDIVISALPLSFDYGLYQMIMMVAVGGTLILEKDFVLPMQFLRLIEKYKPTALPLVPSMIPLLVQFNEFKKYDLSSIRYITNTGATLMLTHITTLGKFFPKAKIFSMYGLTECKRCTYLPPEDISRKSGSVGIPIPGTEMWVVDENGNNIGINKVGEIVVRGPTVMKGYWNKPTETSKKLKPGKLLGEYLLFTGDFGMVDSEGYFYFQDRMDEVIKSRGMKVSPKEIETIVIQHPDIFEVAAVGVEHSVYGQAIVLFIASQNQKLKDVEVYDFCKEKLQAYQMPIDIIINFALPKTTNGKLNKRNLAESYRKQRENNSRNSDAL